MSIAACSSEGEGPNNGSDTVTSHVFESYGDAFKNISVLRGQPATVVYTRAWPPGLGVTAVKVDALASLEHIDVTITSTGGLTSVLKELVLAQAQPSTAEITCKIASEAEAATVCETGFEYGPFTIGLDTARRLISAEPQRVDGKQDVIGIVNTGLVVTCIRIVSPFDATISVNGLELEVTRKKCTEAPAAIEGRWVGTYECTSSCSESFGGDVDLSIDRDADDRFSYTDASGDFYEGYGCGNTFRFARNEAVETENGTFTLQADGTAKKSSTWRGTSPPFCFGECTDTLRRP